VVLEKIATGLGAPFAALPVTFRNPIDASARYIVVIASERSRLFRR
jgi:hypothetical protein